MLAILLERECQLGGRLTSGKGDVPDPIMRSIPKHFICFRETIFENCVPFGSDPLIILLASHVIPSADYSMLCLTRMSNMLSSSAPATSAAHFTRKSLSVIFASSMFDI